MGKMEKGRGRSVKGFFFGEQVIVCKRGVFLRERGRHGCVRIRRGLCREEVFFFFFSFREGLKLRGGGSLQEIGGSLSVVWKGIMNSYRYFLLFNFFHFIFIVIFI